MLRSISHPIVIQLSALTYPQRVRHWNRWRKAMKKPTRNTVRSSPGMKSWRRLPRMLRENSGMMRNLFRKSPVRIKRSHRKLWISWVICWMQSRVLLKTSTQEKRPKRWQNRKIRLKKQETSGWMHWIRQARTIRWVRQARRALCASSWQNRIRWQTSTSKKTMTMSGRWTVSHRFAGMSLREIQRKYVAKS